MSHSIIQFIIFLFPLAYSPGPGNIYFASLAAQKGLKATVVPLLGYHIATWLITTILAYTLQIGFTLNQFPLQGVQTLGGLYILWLARLHFQPVGSRAFPRAKAVGFFSGVALLILNPKAYVILSVVIAKFGTQLTFNAFEGALLFASIFTLNNLIAFLFWSALGAMSGPYLYQMASAALVQRGFGILLTLTGLWMIIS